MEYNKILDKVQSLPKGTLVEFGPLTCMVIVQFFETGGPYENVKRLLCLKGYYPGETLHNNTISHYSHKELKILGQLSSIEKET